MDIMKWTNDYILSISTEHWHVSILILNISLLMLAFTSKNCCYHLGLWSRLTFNENDVTEALFSDIIFHFYRFEQGRGVHTD